MVALLSEEKEIHLSHVLLQWLQQTSEARITGDHTTVLKEIKRVLAEQIGLEKEIDRKVRQRVLSYSRKIPEGSTEWDVLYQKTYSEELRKRNLG